MSALQTLRLVQRHRERLRDGRGQRPAAPGDIPQQQRPLRAQERQVGVTMADVQNRRRLVSRRQDVGSRPHVLPRAAGPGRVAAHHVRVRAGGRVGLQVEGLQAGLPYRQQSRLHELPLRRNRQSVRAHLVRREALVGEEQVRDRRPFRRKRQGRLHLDPDGVGDVLRQQLGKIEILGRHRLAAHRMGRPAPAQTPLLHGGPDVPGNLIRVG